MSHRSGQKGMTLVEVMIASAITAVIAGGLSVAIFMTVNVSGRGNDEASAMHDVQTASYWISHDTQMASTTDLVEAAEAVDSVVLEWTGCYGNSHTSTYSLSGTELQRDYDGATITVAQYVSLVEFYISGNVLTFRIESNPPGRWNVSQDMTGNACLRPNT